MINFLCKIVLRSLCTFIGVLKKYLKLKKENTKTQLGFSLKDTNS